MLLEVEDIFIACIDGLAGFKEAIYTGELEHYQEVDYAYPMLGEYPESVSHSLCGTLSHLRWHLSLSVGW
jgi:hypothetical protein